MWSLFCLGSDMNEIKFLKKSDMLPEQMIITRVRAMQSKGLK